MGYNLTMLENTFMSAYRTNATYIAVRVRIEGALCDEIIINSHKNILNKLDYYKQAYTDNLELKSNPKIKIINATYGNTFEEIQSLI